MTQKHFQFVPFDWHRDGGFEFSNLASPADVEFHELHHELGDRVLSAMEDEAFGMGALFDLFYAWAYEEEQA